MYYDNGTSKVSRSCDGRLIYSATRNGSQDLWITDAAGKEKNQLTHDAGQNGWPAISPDGRTIVFMSTRDGKERLWKMDADGSHAQRLTDGQRDNWPSFTPDGQWVNLPVNCFWAGQHLQDLD